MRAIFLATACLATLTMAPVSASSLVDRDPDDMRQNLGEMFVASFRCHEIVEVQHHALELVYDIFHLKTGLDIDSEEATKAMVPIVNEIDATAKTDTAAFCDQIVGSYGPQGNSIAGLVQPR